MFEGKPMIPDAGVMWRLTEKYKVKCIFASPTAMRLLRKMDFEGTFFKKYDTKSLKIIGFAGEKCDSETV